MDGTTRRPDRRMSAVCVAVCLAVWAVPGESTGRPAAGTSPIAADADAAAALQRAAALVEQGRLDDAARQAELALADPQARAAAYSVLGAIRLRQQRVDDGIRCLEEALRLEPGLRGAQLNLAQAYLAAATRAGAAKDRDAAEALARKWEALGGTAPADAMTFALRLAEAGAAPQAVAILEGLAAAGPPTFALAFNLAGAQLLNGRPAKALAAYDAALAIDPASLPALRQAAAVAERTHEDERALSYWMRARKLTPDDPEILLGFGRVCLRMDLLEDAEPALARAAGLRPDSLPHQYALAAAKVGKKQFEAAQQILEPFVRANPTDAHLQYAVGAILYTQGKLDDAAIRLEESVRLMPDQIAAPYYLALVARDQGRDADAIARFERFLQRHPDHAGAHEALGGLLMTAQQLPEAETHLRAAIAGNPGSVKANYQLGLLLARVGRKAESEQQLAHAKTLREQDAATSRLQLRLLDPGQ